MIFLFELVYYLSLVFVWFLFVLGNLNDLLIWMFLDGIINGLLLMVFFFVFFNLMLVLLLLGMWISVIVFIIVYCCFKIFREYRMCSVIVLGIG